MTEESLKRILVNSEGTEIEYKKSQTGLARSVYESICAFLNRRGGHVVLGADDDGTILGIQPDKVQEQLDTLAKDMNNPQVMNPTFYLNYEPLDIDGKKVIYFYVPESSQAHNHKGVYYDHNQDGDFALKNNQQVADLMTGKDGYTLAAALLFGTERTLTSVVPFYKIDALCRRHDTDLYDARDLIHCNLLRAYDRLMAFGRQNLPEWPYIEGDQRKSLRDILMREVSMNLLIHAEYGARHDSKLTIWKDRIEIINWNIPYGYGLITLDNLRPHAKNPTIANFFAQLGIVEELGRGTRALYEYVPKISGGQMPVIEEKDEFKVVIPYQEVVDDTPNDSQNDSQNDSLQATLNQLTQRQIAILRVIQGDSHVTVSMIAAKLKVSVATIHRELKKINAHIQVCWTGPSVGGQWQIVNP